MKRRKLIALLMAALMLASVTACGGAPAASQAGAAPTAACASSAASRCGTNSVTTANAPTRSRQSVLGSSAPLAMAAWMGGWAT